MSKDWTETHRLYADPIPPVAWQKHVDAQPPAQREIIRDCQATLSGALHRVGPATALQILWAIGRAMEREEGEEGEQGE